MSTVIFDFDGTIADTFDLIADVTYELSGARRLPPKELNKLKKLPILTAIQKIAGSSWHIPKLLLLTRRRMQPRMDTVPIYPGMARVLADLQASGHRLFIMSSDSVPNVSAFLHTHDLGGCFEAIYTVWYGSTGFKARALKKIVRRLGLNPSECYYVGNEPLDVRAAKRAGVGSVAAAWNVGTEDVLSHEGPDYLARRPHDLLALND